MFLFERQKDFYSCGAFAFRNACALLGIMLTIPECKKMCNTISFLKGVKKHLGPSRVIHSPLNAFKDYINAPGTSEEDLLKAAKRLKLKTDFIDTEDEEEFREFIFFHANCGHPVITAVNYSMRKNDSGHWITCAGTYQKSLVIIDSAPIQGEVLQLQRWNDLRNRFQWYDGRKKYYEFIAIALKP